MATRAEIIDSYAKTKNYYPHVAYRPLGKIIVEEVERMGPGGLYLSTACALIEKESGFKQIFGCDWGSRWTTTPPYCNVEVTRERVAALIQNVYAGGGQNGVGTTQLTSIGLIEEAERMGGAHLARYQMRVGFRYLNDLIARLGWPGGAAAYNAGAGNYQSVMHTYGASMARLEREWAARLARASDAPKPKRSLAPARFSPLPVRSTGNYQERHPTRYIFRSDVEALIRRIYANFGWDKVHINTYVGHPEVSPRDTVSFDVWGPGGRNDWIDPRLGQAVFDYIFEDPNPPMIEWCIWRRHIWYRSTGRWQPFGDGTVFTNHDDHSHFTFSGPYQLLS